MTHQDVLDLFDRMLGVLGLFLILVLGKLTLPAYRSDQRGVARVTGFLARRAIDGIAVIGWIVDRLPALPGVRSPTGSSHPSARHIRQAPARDANGLTPLQVAE